MESRLKGFKKVEEEFIEKADRAHTISVKPKKQFPTIEGMVTFPSSLL